MKEFLKIIRSIRFALEGMRHAYSSDKSFRMEVRYGLPIYFILAWFLWPMESTELLIYLLSYFLILAVELLNTAIEKMLDRLHPEKHELIKRSKDIASAAVLVTFFFAVIVVFVIMYTHLAHNNVTMITRTFV